MVSAWLTQLADGGDDGVVMDNVDCQSNLSFSPSLSSTISQVFKNPHDIATSDAGPPHLCLLAFGTTFFGVTRKTAGGLSEKSHNKPNDNKQPSKTRAVEGG